MDGVAACELILDCPSALLITHFHSAFDYIYVLFWNSIWTLAPVVGIGLFDRFLGAQSMLTLTAPI
jgi:hypothetical protein